MKRSLLGSILLPVSLLLLLVLGLRTVSAAPVGQVDGADASGLATGESAVLDEPWQIRLRQQLPISLLVPGTLTDTATLTDRQTISLVLDLDLAVTVTQTLTSTVPASVTLRLSDVFTLTVPISVTLAPITQMTIVLTPQAVLTTTASVTTTLPLTASTSITPATSITATQPPTNGDAITATEATTETEAITAVATPAATEELPEETPAEQEPAETVQPAPEEAAVADPTPVAPQDDALTGIESVAATAVVTSNLRAEPNTTAAIVDTAGTGQGLELVAVSDDGEWYLLTSGAWIFGDLLDAAPAELPVATPALIAAVQEAAAAQPEAPAAPTPAEEAPAADAGVDIAPTVNVDANLRSGPDTDSPIIGGTITGQVVNIIGQNSTGEWYLLDNGGWVASFLVDNAPADVPVVPDDATPESLGATGAPAGGPILVPTPTPGGAAGTGTAPSQLDQADRVYLGEVTSVLTRYETNAETITAQIEALTANPDLLQQTAWRNEMLSAANTLLLSGQQVRRLEPPPLFAGAHVDLRSASGSYDLVAELIEDGITSDNATTFRQVLAEVDFAGTLIQMAREKLSAATQ